MAMSYLESFQNTFNVRYESWLDQQFDALAQIELPDFFPVFSDHVRTLLRGGKRSRAYLIAVLANDMTASSDEVFGVCCAVELFHSFILIHDDINDSALVRRGVPTLHTFIAGYYDGDTKKGIDQAIIIGDLLHAWVTELLADMTPQVRQLFRQMVESTVMGQMIDISIRGNLRASLDQIREKDMRKTAYYSFVYPMRLGAVLAGHVDEGVHELLLRLGQQLGLAYQMQDDLLDFRSTKSGKIPMGDIQEGQMTQMVYHFLQHADEQQQSFFLAHFGQECDADVRQQLHQAFEATGTLSWAEQESAQIVESSLADQQALRELLNTEQLEYVTALIAKFNGRMV